MAIPAVILSAGLPILLDIIKSAGGAVSRKWLGLSVDDQIKLDNANIDKLKALADLDNPHGTPSQWVIDLRGSFRYVAAASLIVGGLGVALYGATEADPALIAAGFDLAASPFGFIFGERLVLSFKGGAR